MRGAAACLLVRKPIRGYWSLACVRASPSLTAVCLTPLRPLFLALPHLRKLWSLVLSVTHTTTITGKYKLCHGAARLAKLTRCLVISSS